MSITRLFPPCIVWSFLLTSLAASAARGDSAPTVGQDLKQEWENQFASLQADPADRGRIAAREAQTLRPESLILAADRDPTDIVLRRTAALLADLKQLAPTAALADAEQQLASLQAANQKIAPHEDEACYALFVKTCQLRRRIAFANPLLDFQELLFVKRHRAIYTHMCDQYYGIAARPGGGLCVLSDPWGPNPRVRDVLADAVAGNGRLKGQKLSGGPDRWWNIQ